MRLSYLLFGVGLTLLLAIPFSAQTAHGQEVNVGATLTGGAEVPPVTTDASGTFDVRVRIDQGEASFELGVSNLVGVTQAHVHCAPTGENGPVAVFLFGEGMEPGDELPSPAPTGALDAGVDVADGLLSSGILTADNLVGEAPCAASIVAFANAVLNGETYVNVHTEANPSGELRGQIVPLPPVGPPPVGDSARFTGTATIDGVPLPDNHPGIGAQVNGINCGSGFITGGTYTIDVASDLQGKEGCGKPGDTVVFVVLGIGDPGGQQFDQQGIWDNTKTNQLDLTLTTEPGGLPPTGGPPGGADNGSPLVHVLLALGGLAVLVGSARLFWRPHQNRA